VQKRKMSEKTARTRCGKRETATTRNFASWTFCNSHNAFWQVKNCHDAKFVLWLLEKTITTTATRSGNIELPDRVVVVSFRATTRFEVSRTELWKKVSVNQQFAISVMY
jgi:hypothetical protein